MVVYYNTMKIFDAERENVVCVGARQKLRLIVCNELIVDTYDVEHLSGDVIEYHFLNGERIDGPNTRIYGLNAETGDIEAGVLTVEQPVMIAGPKSDSLMRLGVLSAFAIGKSG